MTDGKGATISDSEELNCVVVYQINQQNTWNLTYIVKNNLHFHKTLGMDSHINADFFRSSHFGKLFKKYLKFSYVEDFH